MASFVPENLTMGFGKTIEIIEIIDTIEIIFKN